MRSGLVQTGAWALATGAAVTLSWLGVNAVLSDSAFEPPRTLPLPVPSTPAASAPSATATAPSTGPATPPSPSTSVTADAPTPAPAPSPTAPVTVVRSTPPAAAQSPGPAATGTAAPSVQSYLVPGGRVALDMRRDSAELVSAVPDPGWQMQVWNGDQWLRVDFSQGSSTNSVFVTWNGHPPDVQTVVR